ncbi:nucleotide-binding alpha-beta plait domain-containing protein [Tanacetum coccineum]
MDDEDGWTKVTRNQRRVRNESDVQDRRHGENSFPGVKSKITDFDKVMKASASSFFFTNFTETWDSSALWKMFKNVGNIGEFKRKLKGILIGDEKLVIHMAKFFKSKENGGAAAPIRQGFHSKHKEVRKDINHTFKESVNGPSKKIANHSFKDAILSHKSGPEPLCQLVKFEEDKSIRLQLEKCWIGNAKNFHVLQNSWDIVINNGLEGCSVKYVRGLSLLFEWSSREEARQCLNENKIWLHQWFDDLKLWEYNDISCGRLTWITIEGLPSLARSFGSVKTIISKFGKILEVGRLDFNAKVLSSVKYLVLTTRMTSICQPVDVLVNNKIYPVRVFEEQFYTSSFFYSPTTNDNKSGEEDYCFEEEFIGPTVMEEASKIPKVDSPKMDNIYENDDSISPHAFFGCSSAMGYAQTNDRSLWSNSHVDWAYSSSIGASGGIITMWDSRVFELESKISTINFLGVIGTWRGQSSKIGLLNVYVPQSSSLKEHIWSSLEHLISDTQVVWIIFGDFNMVRSMDERIGSNFDDIEANTFNNFISRTGLCDLPLGGRQFTRFDKEGKKASKLDRFLVTSGFFNMWNDADVSVLCRSVSDHCPIRLKLGLPNFGPKPFRIFDKWIGVEGFHDVVKESWASTHLSHLSSNPDIILKYKLKKLIWDIKEWTSVRIKDQNKARDDLKNKLLEWDLKAEEGHISDYDVAKKGGVAYGPRSS